MTDAAVFAGGFPTYHVILVAANGDVVATATPRVPTGAVVEGVQRSFRPAAPLATTSNTRAYYLDGEYEIHYLAPDGSTGLVSTLPRDPSTRYAFAVSPDDKRLAIAAITYDAVDSNGQPSTSLDLYLQDLSGANRVDLFRSTSVVEWPVGWHAGNLVLAVGPPGVPPSVSIQHDPYWALQYHVVNAVTGDRLTTFGQDSGSDLGNACNWGPLTSAGTACLVYSPSAPPQPISPVTLSIQGWDGVKTDLLMIVSSNYYAPLAAPSGVRLAVMDRYDLGAERVTLVAADGVHPTDVRCEPQAWIDAQRLLCRTTSSQPYTWSVLDLDSLTQHSIEWEFAADPNTRFVGTVPQQMG